MLTRADGWPAAACQSEAQLALQRIRIREQADRHKQGNPKTSLTTSTTSIYSISGSHLGPADTVLDHVLHASHASHFCQHGRLATCRVPRRVSRRLADGTAASRGAVSPRLPVDRFAFSRRLAISRGAFSRDDLQAHGPTAQPLGGERVVSVISEQGSVAGMHGSGGPMVPDGSDGPRVTDAAVFGCRQAAGPIFFQGQEDTADIIGAVAQSLTDRSIIAVVVCLLSRQHSQDLLQVASYTRDVIYEKVTK